MSEMVERLCRKLCEYDDRDPDMLLHCDDESEGIYKQDRIAWRVWVGRVITLLEAMREPTEAMTKAGDKSQTSNLSGEPCAMDAIVPWQAMIDEALT